MASISVIKLPGHLHSNQRIVLAQSNSQHKPIAPKRSNMATNASSVGAVVKCSTNTGRKRGISFQHPTLGYPIAPPQAPAVQRRNARERNRVKQVNNGFSLLRQHIPTAANNKKMSKVDTLRHAVEYIQNLKHLLRENDRLRDAIPSSSSSGDEDLLDHSPPRISQPNRILPTTPPLTPMSAHQAQLPQPPPLTPIGATNHGTMLLSPHHGLQHQLHGNQHGLQDQYSSPEMFSSHFYGVHQQPQITQLQQFSSNESGYETSGSYYGHTPGGGPPVILSPSPTNSRSPSVFSEGSATNYPRSTSTGGYIEQQYLKYECVEQKYSPTDEDDILDAIVSWQES